MRAGDTLYLLAGAGDRSDWVRNLQADPRVTRAHGRRHVAATGASSPTPTRTPAPARSCSTSTNRATTASSSPRARALPVALDLGVG